MFFLVALVLPLILIWLAAWLAEELARQRELVAALAEVTAPLTGALAETRAALDRHGPASPRGDPEGGAGGDARDPRPGPRPGTLERLLAGQARIEAALQRLTRARRRARAPTPPRRRRRAGSPSRCREARRAGPVAAAAASRGRRRRPDWADLIRALDFPRDADDREGFRALRAALRHHGLAQMLQAAEDVLNLLSQEGIFVDELPVEPADPAAWRRFIAGRARAGGRGPRRHARPAGARGGAGADASPIRSSATRRCSSSAASTRVLQEFAGEATDAELIEVAGTRSGRAFMLLARLSGSLD